ncbi:helix-hairpin-helix domain-containing protein [Neisseria sicca]|uniref:helix-hairpin-helix domain-containing protein n=1 Tax=Neisseria sicca TaxID=490 RepID=UPI0021C21D88|nr:helix-hairpin-helix domain-containing protein [Neisseria sicca]
MYEGVWRVRGSGEDGWMMDILVSVVDFMEGKEGKGWWDFREEGKGFLGDK